MVIKKPVLLLYFIPVPSLVVATGLFFIPHVMPFNNGENNASFDRLTIMITVVEVGRSYFDALSIFGDINIIEVIQELASSFSVDGY